MNKTITNYFGEDITAEQRREILAKHRLDGEDAPALYVGTYHKYNCGSIAGAWLNLTTFDSYEEWLAVCALLHWDEEDPELMYQDYECFPETFYSESGLDEETFDHIKEWTELDDDEQEAIEAWLSYGRDFDVSDFRDHYMGYWDSEEDFAEHIVSECYDLDRTMGNLACYFDYSRFARDLFLDGYTFIDGHVFAD